MKKIGCRDEYFYDGSHYISKNAYYRGASFLVYPSWEEVNRNILVPGDRWHPFCPPSMPPWEIILTDGNGIIPHKMIPFTLQTLEDYHPILGKKILLMNMQEHLGSDCSRLSLPVLAMGEFYERYDFQVGDALRIKVLDYDSGFYHMEHIRRPEREELDHKSDHWLNLMEKVHGTGDQSFRRKTYTSQSSRLGLFHGRARTYAKTHPEFSSFHEKNGTIHPQFCGRTLLSQEKVLT